MRNRHRDSLRQRLFRRLNRTFHFVSGGSNLISLRSSVALHGTNFIFTDKVLARAIISESGFARPLELTDVIVSPASGNVFKWINGSAYYITESDFRHPYQALWSRQRPKKIPTLHVSEPCVVVPRRSGNYFHFLIEDLPDLIQELELRPERILVNRAAPEFVKVLLNTLFEYEGISDEEIFSRNLIKMPKLQGFEHVVKRERLAMVRKLLVTTVRTTQDLDIFVLRNKNDEFESAIAKIFESKGFKVDTLLELSIFDQIKLFNNARMIVGFAGAGLTNAIFAANPRKSTIVEVSVTESDHLYWRKSVAGECWEPFALALGANYKFLELDPSLNLKFQINQGLKI